MDQNIIQNRNEFDFVVHTFGCKVNTYDTGLIQKNLIQNGFQFQNKKENHNPKAIHILNTCAVTAEATKEAVKTIRKIKAQQPLATVVVTGCAAQVDTGAFENLAGADLVVANSHKGLLPELLRQFYRGEVKEKVFKSNIFKKEDLEADGGDELQHTRRFLKIQDGCNSFCTFCIIPYARGKSRSIPVREIVQKIKSLQNEHVQEVVLTGVHIGDYEDVFMQSGEAIKWGMDDLVEAVLEQTQMPRLRLSSLEPIEISDRLIQLFKNDRLCPHFHMSIQSADTEVLQQMKRKYSERDVRESLQKIHDQIPDLFVGMDVIAGFPTETDEQFENTYKVLSETPWTRLHVFPYSERSGTRAATYAQVPFHQRKERAARLRELSLHRYQSEALKQNGKIFKTLILNKAAKGGAEGLTRHYWPVKLQLSDEQMQKWAGTEVDVKITGCDFSTGEGVLTGVIQ